MHTAAIGAGSLIFPQRVLSSTHLKTNHFTTNLFTKPLDKYGPDFMMDTIKMAGIDGLDLTVRPKGCVLPKKVESDLPRIVQKAKDKGLDIDMMVTNINSIDTPYCERILTVAKQMGIKHYRMGYYRYKKNDHPKTLIKKVKYELEKLAELNKTIGIQGGYQNHTGNYFGAPIWDLLSVLKDIPNEWLSSQYDIRHGVCEGYKSWWVALEMLAPKIGSLAVKDFTWEIVDGRAKVKNVPLGKGIIDFDLFCQHLRTKGIVAPITIHAEYPLLSEKEEQLPLLKKQEKIVSRLKNDLEFIKSKLLKHQIL